MPTDPPPIPPPVAAPLSPPRKKHWLLYGCGALIALLLLIIATVAITIWWTQRPIKPVVLSPKEKATVDEKLRRINDASPRTDVRSNISVQISPPSEATRPGYVPGGKVLKLTEREINGLLNQNTDLGKSVRIEFAKNAINAYVVVPIPQDFPIGGGKMFRGRARFGLCLDNRGEPYAILEDVTVFGLSLPKAWLGGLKGENLLGKAAGERNGQPILRGIKSLHVEPGALVLEVED